MKKSFHNFRKDGPRNRTNRSVLSNSKSYEDYKEKRFDKARQAHLRPVNNRYNRINESPGMSNRQKKYIARGQNIRRSETSRKILKDSSTSNEVIAQKNNIPSNKIITSRLEGIFEGNFRGQKKLFTINLNPGVKVYDESLIVQDGVEYREWNNKKSKLAAGIIKGISQIGVRPGKAVLYLGSASGTTVSHVSDIVGLKDSEGKVGFVVGVDPAPRVMRDFVFLSIERKNILPVLADANHPEKYKDRIPKEFDVIFQDIAQRSQVSIFLKNVKMFLKKGGFAIIALKARSIDVTKEPKELFRKVMDELNKELIVVDYKELAPFEKDHAMFVCKQK